jgi:putative chitinase
MITKELLESVIRAPVSDDIVVALQQCCDAYCIDTSLEVSAFLANLVVESGGFRYKEENLNYSASNLLRVFPTHFTREEAARYAGKPMAIANRVYSNRMGNGPESSGDGWKFRGKGFIQITGKTNVSAYATFKQSSLDEASDYLSTIEGAVDSACWFWCWKNLGSYTQDFEELCRRINGGTNGHDERVHYFHEFLDRLLPLEAQ